MTVYTDESAPTRRRKPHPTRDEPSLFAAPVLATPTREIRGMVRGEDSLESQRAACDIRLKCEGIRRRIMEILVTDGPLNDRELETRNEFRSLGPSSVRKRRGELVDMGLVVADGRRDKMQTWTVKTTLTGTTK